ncbi:MAG: hypothetical protein ACPGES_10040, partial [Coraliomargarita sp.]
MKHTLIPLALIVGVAIGWLIFDHSDAEDIPAQATGPSLRPDLSPPATVGSTTAQRVPLDAVEAPLSLSY